jgi:hypothetical protein
MYEYQASLEERVLAGKYDRDGKVLESPWRALDPDQEDAMITRIIMRLTRGTCR